MQETILKESKSKRQQHLNLEEDCIKRGGSSTHHKGVLAQYLNTGIFSKPVLLCHACHDGECSNPKHLYWGSYKDNMDDSKNNGTWADPWSRMVEKYGYEEACIMNSRKSDPSVAGKGNKNKPKSKEHKENISRSIKEWHMNKE